MLSQPESSSAQKLMAARCPTTVCGHLGSCSFKGCHAMFVEGIPGGNIVVRVREPCRPLLSHTGGLAEREHIPQAPILQAQPEAGQIRKTGRS